MRQETVGSASSIVVEHAIVFAFCVIERGPDDLALVEFGAIVVGRRLELLQRWTAQAIGISEQKGEGGADTRTKCRYRASSSGCVNLAHSGNVACAHLIALA